MSERLGDAPIEPEFRETAALIERLEAATWPDRELDATMKELIESLRTRYGVDQCWAWPRKTDAKGRGRIWVGGKIMLAHRAIWEAVNGVIPNGKFLCHHCDNAGCVNPAHVYVGTHADNMRDMRERGRSFAARNPERAKEVGRATGLTNTWMRGSDNPRAKLSNADADAIRASSARTSTLAEQYQVSRTTIQRIRSGASWPAALKAREAGRG